MSQSQNTYLSWKLIHKGLSCLVIAYFSGSNQSRITFGVGNTEKYPKIVFISDIGANLIDLMYQGSYHGSQKHQPDLENVLERSWAHGLDKIIITGGSLEDSKKALEAAKQNGKFINYFFIVLGQLRTIPTYISRPHSNFRSALFHCWMSSNEMSGD